MGEIIDKDKDRERDSKKAAEEAKYFLNELFQQWALCQAKYHRFHIFGYLQYIYVNSTKVDVSICKMWNFVRLDPIYGWKYTETEKSDIVRSSMLIK